MEKYPVWDVTDPDRWFRTRSKGRNLMRIGWVITDGENYVYVDGVRKDGSLVLISAATQEHIFAFSSWQVAIDFIKENNIEGFKVKMVKGDAEKWHIVKPLCRWQDCKELATYGELCNYHFGL